MKHKGLIIVILIASVVAAVSFTSRTQTNQGASVPVPGQRYAIVCNSSGQFTETYVLDAQNGRIWMVRGEVSKSPYLIPCWYQLLDGHTALSPVDGDREIELARQLRPSKTSTEAQQGEMSPGAQTRPDETKKKLDEDMKRVFPK